MLHINELKYRIDGRILIENATAAIPAGHKVGLVGRNGAGKSTLLKIILGELHAEGGRISKPRNCRIGSVAQEAPGTEVSLLDTVLAADLERSALMAESETATDGHRIAEIQTRLADIDAHSAPSRAARILAGLGFSEEEQARPCSSFSGGWRMRVALAATLFTQPDVLLLDEPTNYLDLEGTLWLETYLRTYPYTVLLVSHDRDLLNKAVTAILHLEQGKLKLYTGGYDRFEKTRREQQELQLKLKTKQEAARRHMQDYVDRFRYKASKAKQAQSRLKAIERMEPIVSVVDEHTIPFRFKSPKITRSPVLRLEHANVGYDEGVDILTDMDLRIDQDDRIALLGANGNGKSTFAKLISGRLPVTAGKLFQHKKLDIAYFAQHQLDELNENANAYDHFQELMGDEATQAQIRAAAGSYGFGIEKVDRPVSTLSGGEKARLLLALATYHGPNMLILDEPTNHLDVDSREALIQALNDYEGAVILISHDRHLIETSADRLWLVADGHVAPYDGDLDDYRDLLLSRLRGGRKGNGKSAPVEAGTKRDQRQDAAAQRKALEPLKKRIVELERKIEKLKTDIAKLDRALAIPALYREDPDKAARFAKKRSDIESLVNEAEEDWYKATEKLEAVAG